MSSSANSASEAENCNTKVSQPNPCVRWIFVLNNYNDEELKEISSLCANSAKYSIYGFEVGESGTPHLQGYIEFKKKVRPFNLLTFKRTHWEVARSRRETNFDYCSKGGHYIINGVEVKPVKIITELRPWQQKVYDIVLKEDDRLIHWIHEPVGNVGKTALLKYIAVKHKKTALVLCGKAIDMKNGIIQFHKINGYYPSIILFNLPRSFNTDHLSLPGIEEIKDGLFYCGKYEGGQVIMNSPSIVIMSNEPLDTIVDFEKCSPERWNSINIQNI